MITKGDSGSGERDKLGVWGWQMQTITFRMDKEDVVYTYTTEYYSAIKMK